MKQAKHWNCRCEFTDCPIGIQTQSPRFSWKPAEGFGAQKAYRVFVSSSLRGLIDREDLAWDSGTVLSGNSTCVCYEGEPLIGKTRYYWQAEITLENYRTVTTDAQFFETGMLSESDWKASWISAPVHEFGVSDLLRKGFTLASAPVSGRLYISGIGYYEAFLNGEKIGDRVLEPGWTDYRKRVLYSVYDVTDSLQAGDNVLGVELAEGWYGMHHPSFTKFMGKQPDWNDTPRMIAELEIELADGEKVCIASRPNAGFFTSPGAVVANSVYDGEMYDARREQPGWNTAAFDDGGWEKAVLAEAPGGILCAQQMPPIRVNCTLLPQRMQQLDGRCIYDFGQNAAGWVSLTASGTEGDKIVIRYGETLHDNGYVNQDNLRGALSCDTLVLKGNTEEHWHPRFTYHGFRYVEVQAPSTVEILQIQAELLWTDVDEIGSFSCSEETLNRCFRMMQWTERSNMHSIPTDCPQRDERMAWLNDVTVRCEEAMYNFDLRLFYEKWLNDIADAQTEFGSLPDTAPHVYCGNPSLHISSCFIVIPWLLYQCYGDIAPLKEHYDQMKRYVEFLNSQRGDEGTIGAPYFGEWAPPAAECNQSSPWSAEPTQIPPGTISTGYLAFDCRIMQKAAELLQRPEDADYFRSLFAEVTDAINQKFYDPKTGSYTPGSQAPNIFPLLLDFAPEPQRVQSCLFRDLQEHDYHITTGNQMTKYWFTLLDKIGRNDIALQMATDKTYPSLGYMAENGATALWERWENLDGSGMNSHNHPMNGAYTVWYYQALAGIHPQGQGKWLLTPGIDLKIREVRAEMQTPYGVLQSYFCRSEEETQVSFTVPWNTSADIALPLLQVSRVEMNGKPVWDKDDNQQNPDGYYHVKVTSGKISFSLKHKSYAI